MQGGAGERGEHPRSRLSRLLLGSGSLSPHPHPLRDPLLDQPHSLGSGDALGQSRVRDGMGA